MSKKENQHKHHKGGGSLFQMHRGTNWIASWMYQGKLYRKSTGTKDRKAAEKILEEFVADFGKKRIVDVQKDILEKVNETMRANTTLKIPEVWEAFLKAPNRRDTEPKTLRTYKGEWERFVRWMREHYPKCLYADITAECVGEFASCILVGDPEVKENEKKPEKGEPVDINVEDVNEKTGTPQRFLAVTNSTYNRYFNLYSQIWRTLAATGMHGIDIKSDPFSPDKVARKTIKANSRESLTDDEVRVLLDKSKDNRDLHLFILFGVYVGARMTDITKFTWEDNVFIDSAVAMPNGNSSRGIVRYLPHKVAKKNKTVDVPIHPALYKVLIEIPEVQRHGFVMPSIAEKRFVIDDNGKIADERDSSILDRWITRFFEKCGLKTQVEVKGESRKRSLKSFHSLRHTAVSAMHAAGTDSNVIAKIVGHGSPIMTGHYTHDIQSSVRAVDAIPDFTAESSGESSALKIAKQAADRLSKEDLKSLREYVNSIGI